MTSTRAERFERIFHWLLPAPFTIAVLLTLITMVLALFFGEFAVGKPIAEQLSIYWYEGVWNAPLLVFAVQMMLILVLGHSLALAPPVEKFIERVIDVAHTPAKAAYLVCLTTLLVAFFNWGLGLIFGAIIARKTGERFAARKQPLNYPLIGAAGYSGLMVWHGGLSGSAPLKAVEDGHLRSLMSGIWPQDRLAEMPDLVPFTETVFSTMNISTSVVLLVLLPALMAFLATGSTRKELPAPHHPGTEKTTRPSRGLGKLDQSLIINLVLVAIILYTAVTMALQSSGGLSFMTPNFINLVLLGLGLLFHGNFKRFTKAVDEAIGGAAGILIQFPLYFGIMGIMRSTGLIETLSEYFMAISNEVTFPLFTFASAGIVNVFVPSGGGQWAIQGPIIVQAASALGVPISKSIMALSYGDQLTNMLQPFWALPLLGITGLKAREILPYTLLLMLAGAVIFATALLVF